MVARMSRMDELSARCRGIFHEASDFIAVNIEALIRHSAVSQAFRKQELGSAKVAEPKNRVPTDYGRKTDRALVVL